MLEQKLDIGLLINFKERHRFHVFELIAEQHLVVGSADYLKTIKPIRHIQDVLSADLIDIDEIFTCLTPWMQKHEPSLINKLDEMTPVIVVPDFHAAKKMILLHQGIGVLPRYLIERELSSGKLVQILPKLSALTVGLDCTWKRGRRERLSNRLFIEALSNHFGLHNSI